RVGGVELHPATARQVCLYPGMRCATADGLVVVEVARDEARGEAEATRRVHHEQCEVATGAGAEPERLDRRLRTLGLPGLVAEFLADGSRHVAQQGLRVGLAVDRKAHRGP